MIQGYVSTSTRAGRGKRRRYVRQAYIGQTWANGVKAIREMLYSLPSGSKGFLSSQITGRYKIVTKRNIKEI